MYHVFVIIIFVIFGIKSESVENGCSMRDVMSCVIQLKSYNVPIDTNMMNVVFNVSSEAKLIHVCRAYNNAMPCFQQRLAICANEKQRLRLAEVNRLLLFICAPFSLQRQKTLLKVGKCIGQVLNLPVTPNCPTKNHRFGYKLMLCRENCEANDVVCLMRVRMSELAVCSVIAIENQCGKEAADFYSYMQTAIIGEEFPIQCKYDFAVGKIRDMLNAKEFDSVETTTLAPHFTVQELVLPSATTKPVKHAVEDMPLLLTKNGKFVPNPELAKKALQIFQTERRKSSFKKAEEDETQGTNRTKIVRTRNFSKLFRPAKFAEINLEQTKKPENTVIIELYPKATNITVDEEEDIPGFLQGARPIPDSYMAVNGFQKNSITKELSENSVAEKFESNLKDLSTLTAAKETYTPKMEYSRTISTTTLSPFSMFPPTTSPEIYDRWPSTMMIMLPPSSSNKDPIPSTVNKFLPWYYNTFTTQPIDQTVTANPIFPYFNPESLSAVQQSTDVLNPYFQGNYNSQQFPVQYISNIPSMPITASPPSQRISDELSNILNSSVFKEKADAFLSTAIDVLKPREKIQQPFSDQQRFYIAPHSPPVPNSQNLLNNKTTSGALSELIDTIERISPTVIDNIREKLDSLSHN